MDKDGYPEDHELEEITQFLGNPKDWYEIIRPLWQFADAGYFSVDDREFYHLSTGGWSGNEDIVRAMRRNLVMWAMYWVQSKRGGHHVFCVDRQADY
jgi:hypothetical protein